MRLAVSNLAFGPDLRTQAYERLARAGVEGVEVALTRIASWDQLTVTACLDEAEALAACGLQASSLQAIYFGKPEAQLLGEEANFVAMLEHTRRVAEFSQALGAKVAVFGAPKNRSRGDRPLEEAVELAALRFRILGEAVSPFGLTLGIEPVPAYYGGDFLPSAEEVTAMVRRVDHPNIRLHLDTGCVMLGGGDIGEAVRLGADVLAHMHAAEPDLGGYEAPVSPHLPAARALHEARYDRWIAIEMREPPNNPLERIETAVRYVRATYWPEQRPRSGRA